MVAFNVVHFIANVGREKEVLDAQGGAGAAWSGLRHANIIETGDRSYCIVVEWEGEEALVGASPQMIATLNAFRESMEDPANSGA